MKKIPTKPTEPGMYVLRSIFEITERRDGMVFKTKNIGEKWIPFAEKNIYHVGDLIYASISTHRIEELLDNNINTIITVR